MSSRWLPAFLAAAVAAAPAAGQVDPDRRRLVQFGTDLPLSGPAPFGGYAFFYYNQPGFYRKRDALRLALAPVYVDAEYADTLGPSLDLGLGLAGGGFAYGHSEFRGGEYKKEDSFTGHGAGASSSVYLRLNPGRRIPLSSVIRLSLNYVSYERGEGTARDFALPADNASVVTRVGLRLGGQEPLLDPQRAGELSAWYESRFRSAYGPYGYGEDRLQRSESHLFWLRSLLAYTQPENGRQFAASLVAGNSFKTERLDAFRMGGNLPLASEFPLSLPGYYNQELFAKRFFLLAARGGWPLDEARRFDLSLHGAGALVHYLPGMGQRGAFNSGVGAGLNYDSPWKVWRVELGYGYGVQAQRSGGRGAHSVSLLVQCDLEAQAYRDRKLRRRQIRPSKQQGLQWLFPLIKR